MFSKLPRPPYREQRTACRLSLALMTIPLPSFPAALSPTPPFFTSHPMEPYHFYFHQTRSANLPALLQLPPSKLALRLPGGSLTFPISLSQTTPQGTGRIGLLPVLSHFFSADPGFTGPRLPYTPASAPISVPSTCHSPAPAAAERTKTRAAHLCAAFRARG